MVTFKAVLFDLDGTLVDSAPDLCGAMNHVLVARGYPPLVLAQVRHLMGEGARLLLARGFWGKEATPPQEDEAFEQAVVDFLSYYREHLADHTVPYPGVVQMLQTLQQQGLALAVVTNKPEDLARRLLDQLNLASFFRRPREATDPSAGLVCVVGGDTLAQHKPSAEPLWHFLSSWGIPPGSALMVGDSATDREAARAAGCPVVLMSHGYSRGTPVRQLNPDWVLDTFERLPGIVQGGASVSFKET